jgi:D-alanyl-D-alanine carboxypeptidase (penicillin-binding protein 5/6)
MVSAASALPAVSAEAAILMVANSKEVLYEKNAHGYMYPASTTKIMTLLVALEHGNPKSIVTVDPSIVGTEGSSLELEAGDKLTLHDLLAGMMAVSGNDAAEETAEYIGGSREGFIAMMNETAQRIGAVNTHFSNPHGLPDPVGHYTTAYDLGLITATAFQRPDFIQYISKPKVGIKFLNTGKWRTVNSTNKFLKRYVGANGVKTGFTNDAGDCLVASAKRNGVQLIAVLLNDDYRWEDAQKLLDYGFELQKNK